MEEINLKEVYNYFVSKILWILIAVVGITIIGSVYSIFFKTPMYRSNTSIVLANNKKQDNSDIQLNKNLLGTYTEIIKSRTVLQKVIDNLKLENTINEISNRISVSAVDDAQLIKINVVGVNSEEVARITNEIAKVTIEQIKSKFKLENVSVLDTALVSENPYNINLIKDEIIYLALGLALSCLVVFIFYYFDTTIKSDEVVEQKLGLTVLGIVPKENRD